MSLKSNFELMADYDRWMNERTYEAVSTLGVSERSENRGAFFGSIMGTLNHILVGDTIWLKRFSGHPAQLETLEYVRSLQTPEALGSILYAELYELQEERTKMDHTIQQFSHELSDEILSSFLSYSNTKGELYRKNMGHHIQHFFNHKTHHRGQVSTLLNQANVDVGVTDLLVNIPNE